MGIEKKQGLIEQYEKMFLNEKVRNVIFPEESLAGKMHFIDLPAYDDNGNDLKFGKDIRNVVGVKFGQDGSLKEISPLLNERACSFADVEFSLSLLRSVMEKSETTKTCLSSRINWDKKVRVSQIFDETSASFRLPKQWTPSVHDPEFAKSMKSEDFDTHQIFLARPLQPENDAEKKFLPFADFEIGNSENLEREFEVMGKKEKSHTSELQKSSFCFSTGFVPKNIVVQGSPETEIFAVPSKYLSKGEKDPMNSIRIEADGGRNISKLSLISVQKGVQLKDRSNASFFSNVPLTSFPKIGESQKAPLELLIKGPINEATLLQLASHPQKEKISSLTVHVSQRPTLEAFAKENPHECCQLPAISVMGPSGVKEWPNAAKLEADAKIAKEKKAKMKKSPQTPNVEKGENLSLF